MSAYNLNINDEYHAVWHTYEQAHQDAERYAGTPIVFEINEYAPQNHNAYFIRETGHNGGRVFVHIGRCDDVMEIGYCLSMKTLRSGVFSSLESIKRILGMAQDGHDGFLTDFVLIPQTQIWTGLFWGRHTGVEVATVVKIEIQGIPEKLTNE